MGVRERGLSRAKWGRCLGYVTDAQAGGAREGEQCLQKCGRGGMTNLCACIGNGQQRSRDNDFPELSPLAAPTKCS